MGFQNFYATKLQNSIGASDTTIKVQTPPTVTSGRLVLEPRNPSKREIIQFTGVSGTDLTGVVRGIGGTSPTPHNNGSLVQMSVVAEDLDDALNINGNLIQYTDEMFADNVVRGTGEVTTVSGRTASISDITYYMGGIRLTKTGIPNKTFTASRDTYCYIDTLGAVSYVEVTVNAAPPATPANSLLFAKVVTNASTITSVTRMSSGALGDTGWITIPFTNGDYTNSTFQFRKLGGVVYAQGAVMKNSGNIPNSWTDICDLPNEMRMSGYAEFALPRGLYARLSGGYRFGIHAGGVTTTNIYINSISFAPSDT